MPLILGTNSIKDTGYEVANSLRFNDDDLPRLTRTPSSSGNRRTYTISAWIKIGAVDTGTRNIFSAATNGSNYAIFRMENHRIEYLLANGSVFGYLSTNRLFRDPSAWYHIVVAIDTTNATAGNRMRLYVNGVEETDFATDTNPSLNADTLMNHTNEHNVGMFLSSSSGSAFDGYIAELVVVDGQQLNPTSFGEFDEDSPTIWKPKDVSGLTFGTNGVYLDFENSSTLGNDVSGNNNDYSSTNLASTDQTTDTCTNNACTFNPLRANNDSGTLRSPSFDNGNLRAIFDDSGYNELAFASIGVDTGKWFCEMKAEDITATGNTRIGVLDMDYTGTGNPADQSSSVSYLADGQKRVGGSNSSYGASYTSGDIIGVALDVTNNTVTFYKNGASQGSISITANTLYTFYCEDYASSGNKEISANFSSPAYSVSSGNSDANGYGNFEYTVPSGYYALNTKNLAEFG